MSVSAFGGCSFALGVQHVIGGPVTTHIVSRVTSAVRSHRARAPRPGRGRARPAPGSSCRRRGAGAGVSSHEKGEHQIL
eukprot:6381193-Prymnesium_polylepis.1